MAIPPGNRVLKYAETKPPNQQLLFLPKRYLKKFQLKCVEKGVIITDKKRIEMKLNIEKITGFV